MAMMEPTSSSSPNCKPIKYHSESDRLEIDHLPSSRFVLCGAHVFLVHRGTLAYASKELIAQCTDFDKLVIGRLHF